MFYIVSGWMIGCTVRVWVHLCFTVDTFGIEVCNVGGSMTEPYTVVVDLSSVMWMAVGSIRAQCDGLG